MLLLCALQQALLLPLCVSLSSHSPSSGSSYRTQADLNSSASNLPTPSARIMAAVLCVQLMCPSRLKISSNIKLTLTMDFPVSLIGARLNHFHITLCQSKCHVPCRGSLIWPLCCLTTSVSHLFYFKHPIIVEKIRHLITVPRGINKVGAPGNKRNF